MSRPSKLTPEVELRLTQLLRAGLPPEVAAVGAGVGLRSYHRWRSQNAAFRVSTDLAIAEAESILVTRMAKEASRSWRAASWLLERRWPERWSMTERKPVTGEADPFAEFDELAARRRAAQQGRLDA